MLTDRELQALMAGPESDRVERTISTTVTDKFAEAICAFSNETEERILAERRTALAKLSTHAPVSVAIRRN